MNPKTLETRNCRTSNCTGIANTKYQRGPYAGLCEEVCLPAAREAMSRKQRDIAAAKRGEPVDLATRQPVQPKPTFELKAKQLVKVGRTLDQAVARFKPAKQTLEQAMADWKAAVRRLAEGEA